MEVKQEVIFFLKQNDCDLWELERHLVFEDDEFTDYLKEGEYNIMTDNLKLFQEIWILTSNFMKELLTKYTKEEIKNIFEEIKKGWEK